MFFIFFIGLKKRNTTDNEDLNYLYMTYKRIDIVVQVLKKEYKENNNYSLIIDMFRFTAVY
jgi:hypothetical protein